MSENGSTDRPNIVFFFSDQQRWDTAGCYGNDMNVTPNLDRMASEGVKFEHAFTCQPVCGPARACLQTGKYATETGVHRNGIALGQDETTIAHLFSQAGYEVAYIGKWHLASTKGLGDQDANYRTSPVPPERRGGWKDYWLASDVLEFTSHGYDGYMFDGDMNKVEFEGYRADCQTDFVLDYLKNRRSGDKPFFLFVSYIEPHHQNDRNRYEGPDGSKERFGNFTPPGDLADTEGDWRENYADYLGCCASLDYNLGRVRDQLKKLGLADNTLMFYTSDHGSHFRTRNREYKRSCHESSIHIPMVANGPGFKGGKTVDDIVSLIDVPPTFLEEAKIDIPSTMQGRPLQQVTDGAPADWPEEAFVQISEDQVGRAIRTKRWKYSVYAPDKDGGKDPGSDEYVEQFLYDLENDPHEKNNLVTDPKYAGIRKDLAEHLKKRMVQANEKDPVIKPASADPQRSES